MAWIQELVCLAGVFSMTAAGLVGHGGQGHGGGGHAQSYVSFGGGEHVAHGALGAHLGSSSGGGSGHYLEPVAHPKYAFKYGVHDAHTGDVKDQAEERDGGIVKGEYSLLQPDGTKRTVHYTADDHNGFNAVVSISGHAAHPEVHHAPAVHAAPVLVKTLALDHGHGLGIAHGSGQGGHLVGGHFGGHFGGHLGGHLGGHGATSYVSGGLIPVSSHGGHGSYHH